MKTETRKLYSEVFWFFA